MPPPVTFNPGLTLTGFRATRPCEIKGDSVQCNLLAITIVARLLFTAHRVVAALCSNNVLSSSVFSVAVNFKVS